MKDTRAEGNFRRNSKYRNFLRHFLLVVCTVILTSPSVSCTNNNNGDSISETQPEYSMSGPPDPTIRIFLFSFERGELLQVTDTPNSDVVLTKAPGYFQAYMFECNGTFPVQWSYAGDG
ncbi:unnamed protein product, partial [Allacma fusca]